ncbi:MAG: 23S rRNA (uracil(1939)-C(5))-methyltransferase RlmD [Candidatus Omnitrophica bacterium]|nr:23S rRNA (uracil(1939)-C(5))-methyltransferase RlmD [Candidatus Omnitrophota bacterium]
MDCDYFPTCGGCDFRDKTYSEQLEYKEKFCNNLLARFNVTEFSPIIPSPQTDHYRHKMDFCAGKAGNNILLGMRQKSRSTTVVDIQNCRVFFPGLGEILEIFRKWCRDHGVEPYELYKASGEFRYASIRHSKSSGKLMVVGVFAISSEEFDRQKEKFQALGKELQEVSGVASIYFCINNKLSDETFSGDLRLWSGEKYISERLNGMDYLVGPTTFLQSNPSACAKLYQAVIEAARDCAGAGDILDMYCGCAGISLQLAGLNARIKAVDNSPRNIEDARENARLNNINNIEFICEDAEAYLAKAKFEEINTLILDPPRSGLSKKTLKIVLDCKIKNIIYVSCNPLNLREDLIHLSQFYKVEKAIPVDMFPHTRHIELAVKLTKQ